MKKLELVLVGIVVMVLSFPLMYLGMLLATGNAKLVFKGDLARKIEIDNQQRLERQSEVRDSLLLVHSFAYKANQEERKRLEEEKEQLLKEQERLQMLQAELSRQRDELDVARKKFEEVVTETEEFNQKRLKKLARVYGAMKANEAARILETLDDSLCIDIFKFMSEDRQKAKILAAMSGAKAARLSEKMGIKLPMDR